jgi:hypothetical protein
MSDQPAEAGPETRPGFMRRAAREVLSFAAEEVALRVLFAVGAAVIGWWLLD